MSIFVRRPAIAIVLCLVILCSGLVSIGKISVVQFPKIESTALVISTSYPGAAPQTIQGFITEPIERAAMTVPGVDFVDSESVSGRSTVTAWLELNENSTAALSELTARLNQIGYLLPVGAEDPAITVSRADRASGLFYLDVESDSFNRAELSDFLNRRVNPQLASIEGVQRISLSGGRDPAMRIWIDPQKLSVFNLGANDVLRVLERNNVVAALGRVENSWQRINLLSNANLRSVNDFENLVLRQTEQNTLRLRDVARVELGEDRGTINARYNDKITVYVAIWPLPGANEIEIGNELYERLRVINKSLPSGMEISVGYDGTLYMRDALKEIFITLLETIILVGIVVIAMMGSLRTSLVPLITIPISIIGSIALMSLMGFSLNLLTVLAIVLSVGLVVDDAIVVVENVARHMRQGLNRIDAALLSSKELLSPIFAMTFTLAAVYIPIGFVSGLTGSLFKEFAFTLAIAVAISGVVAVTLSPIMSAYACPEFGREGRLTLAINSVFDRLKTHYLRLLDLSLSVRNQVLFIGAFLSILIVPLYLFSEKELAPVEDEGGINIVIDASPEASLELNNDYMNDVIDLAHEMPGLDMVWQIISHDGGFGGIEFVDYAERNFSVHDLLPGMYAKLNTITGLKVFPILAQPLPTAGNFDVELVVQGPDGYEVLAGHAQKLIRAAMQSGKFLFADTDLKVNLPHYHIEFQRDQLADLGMNVDDVSRQISSLIAESDVNRFDHDGKALRVIPMLEGWSRGTPGQILDLNISTPTNELVPLRAVAELQTQVGPRMLATFNQRKAFRIFGATAPGVTNAQALKALEQAAAESLPAGYTLDYAGVSRQLRQEGNSLNTVLGVALVVVYLALVVQFNSFRLPMVVLLGSVPLALASAMLFTFLDWTTINMFSQIGFITLVGLIAKNGILIVEFAHQQQRLGQRKLDAIRHSAATRLRPVLMTTAATVLGHFPLILVTGAGAESRNSIGIVLVAGMAIGTLLTLFILPSVYALIANETDESADAEVASRPIEGV